MAYIAPDIDDDQLAAYLANPARAAAMKQPGLVPPGVDPRMMNPPPTIAGGESGSSVPMSAAPPAANVAPVSVAAQPQPAAPAPAMLPARPQPPTAPTMADDPYAQKISDLRTQISQANPKWWERALGGLSAGMIAYGSHDPATAMQIGSSVTNRQRENLQAKLDPLQQQETDYRARTEKEFSDKSKAYEDTIKQQRADADEELKKAHAGRFDYLSMSPKERADQVADLEKTSGLKFTDMEKSSFILTGKVPTREQKPSLPELMKQREQEGTAAGLKGDALMYYKLNGKLREPNPEAEARLEDARSRHADSEADRHQREDDSNFNKSAARTAEYNKQKAAIDERKAKAYQDLEDKVRQKNNRTATGEVDDVTLNNRKAAIEKEFASAYASLGAPPQERVTNRAPAGNQSRSSAAPAQHQNAAPAQDTVSYKGKTYKTGVDKVSVGGQQYTVKGINKQTGKLILGQ